MIPAELKAKMVNAARMFNAPLNVQTEKFFVILDTSEHHIVRQCKRFPITTQQDVILYRESIKDAVIQIARELSKTSMTFIAEVSVLKSFMFFIDPMKGDIDRYTIRYRWVDVLNESTVGDIRIIAAFKKQ
jgi:hypothetical protein